MYDLTVEFFRFNLKSGLYLIISFERILCLDTVNEKQVTVLSMNK